MVTNDQIMIDFMCSLHQIQHDFFKQTLELIEKYFNLRYLLFISEQAEYTDPLNNGRSKRLFYIGNHFDPALYRNFLKASTEKDIFYIQNPSDSCSKSYACLMDDKISHEAYLQLDYGKYFQKYNLYNIACIYLYEDDVLFGRILIFNKDINNKPVLTQLESIGRIISSQYACYKRIYQSMKKDMFHQFYDNVAIGTAILNNQLMITEANEIFSEFCEYILKHGGIEEYTLQITDENESTINPYAQKLVNYFGSNLLLRPDRIKIDCLMYNFKVHCKPIIQTNDYGFIDSMYCIYITQYKKIQNKQTLKQLEMLTDRELTILTMVTNGYNNQEIEEKLYISMNTIKTHLRNIYRKLDVTNRSELIAKLYLNQYRI